MRVLILSQYYRPEPIPKPVEFASGLCRAGDEVTVITGFPDYPAGVLYEGYQLRLVQEEAIDGARVFRTFEYPYHGTRAVGRFANYTSFMLSAPLAALFIGTIDVMYVWHPPLTIGIAAWAIARLRGIPFVYDVQDIWPEAAVLAGVLKPGFVVKCLSLLERFVYSRADAIITVTEGARQNVISKGVPSTKVTALPHWFDESVFLPEATGMRDRLRAQYGWEGECVLLFAGNLGLVQGLETIIRAAEICPHEAAVRFVFVGDGSDRPRLQTLVATLGLASRVQFIERQPLDAMPGFMAAADALIVHLKHSELSNYVIPTKTLAYLGSGTPILMAMHGAAAEMVREAGAGMIVPPEDPVALAGAARRLAVMGRDQRLLMGRNGPRYLRERLSPSVVLPRYRALLQNLVRGHRTEV